MALEPGSPLVPIWRAGVQNLAMKTGRLCLLLVAALVAGCGGGGLVALETTFPAPVVEQLPLQIGLLYGDNFRAFEYNDEETKWRVPLGADQTRLFDNVFRSMFTSTTEVSARNIDDPGIDAILEPVLDEYAFITPRETGTGFYAVSMKYRIKIYRPGGDYVGHFPMVAYGKSRSGIMNKGASLGEATTMALRDAAAALATQFREEFRKEAWRSGPAQNDDEQVNT